MWFWFFWFIDPQHPPSWDLYRPSIYNFNILYKLININSKFTRPYFHNKSTLFTPKSQIAKLNNICTDHSSTGFFPLFFFLEVLLGFFVSKGESGAKLIFFSDSVLTKNDGAFTKFFPTLMCLCLIKTLAWWIDFAWNPSLKILVCSLLSKILFTVRPKT